MEPRHISIAIVLALLFSAPVRARAEQGDDGAFTMPPIEVHARRSLLRSSDDAAAASTVIVREDLDVPGVDLPAVLDASPGLHVTRLGGLGDFATVRVRGSTGDQVRVYLDGVLLNSADGRPVDLGALALGPIERVEVYRSAAPLGLGAGTIGGVVHIRTRAADERRLELSAEGGSFGTRRARGLFSLPGEVASFLVSVDYDGSEGDFSFRHDNGTAYDPADDRDVTRRNNDFNAVSGLAKLRLRLGRGVSLTIEDVIRWRDRGLPGVALFETLRSRLSELNDTVAVVLEGGDVEGLTDDEPSWRVRAGFSFARRQLFDPDAEVGLGRRDTDDWAFLPSLGADLRWPLASWVAARLVADYRFDRFVPENAYASPPSGAASARHEGEIGAEVELRVEALGLTLLPSVGLLVAQSELYGRDAFGQDATSAREDTDIVWTARLGLVEDLLPGTLLKANVGRSVRLPSLFELFGDSGYVRGSPGLRPERAWFVDAGVVHEASWLPRPFRLAVELFGFYREVDDLIQFVQTSQHVSVAENIDAARLFGVELGLRAELFRHLRARTSYTLLMSEDRSGVAARAGKDLPYRPRHEWSARLEFFWGFGATVPELGVFVEGSGMSGNVLDPANLVRTPSRAYVAAGVWLWMFDRTLRLQVVGRNLADERTVDLAGFPLPGRSFFASLLWRAL